MRRRSESGSSSTWVLLSIIMSILFVLALGFGIWAFAGRSDYKNNSDKKATAAVNAAQASQQAKLEKDFAEQEKSPLRSFHGSSTYGSVIFNYTKTWSAYVNESTGASAPIDGYFYPLVVPGLQTKTAFALRLQIVASSYDQVLQQYQNQINAGRLRATAYIPPKLATDSSVLPGVKLDGALDSTKTGTMVLLKVRDKTLKIWTESNDFKGDFNETILSSLTFSP